MNNESRTWREYLSDLISDPQQKQQIAEKLGVNSITLMRWISGYSTPRLHNLRLLLRIWPLQSNRDIVAQLIEEEFPDFNSTSRLPETEDLELEEIPAAFYRRVISAYATSPMTTRFWSIGNLILQQVLDCLDPNQSGMLARVYQCVPPPLGSRVRTLCESIRRDTRPSSTKIVNEPHFVGIESLPGYVVTTCHPIVFNSQEEIRRLFPGVEEGWENSIVGHPIYRAEKIAGCLLISSKQLNYFLPSHLMIIENLAALFILAFEPEDFYDISSIDLSVVPIYQLQKPLIANFQQRVIDVIKKYRREKKQLNNYEAEKMVWQQMELDILEDSENIKETIQQKED